MYANLLASAMMKNASAVHPAFVHVIQQLTPDEVVILEKASQDPAQVDLNEAADSQGYVPGEKTIRNQFQRFCAVAGVVDLSASDSYLDNLLRLKILTEDRWNESSFRPAGYSEHGDYPASVEDSAVREISLSAFGERFLRTCATPSSASVPPGGDR